MKKMFLVLSLILASFHLSAETESAPWYAEKFPEKLVLRNGKKINTASVLNGKMVAVYFSASWCGPCRGFTPHLVKFYNKVRKKKSLEIVFISLDKNSDAMMNYMKSDKMSFAAVPWNDSKGLQLKKELRISGIPSLVVFDEQGKLVSRNGRWDVMLLDDGAVDAWKSKDYKTKTYEDWKNSPESKKKSNTGKSSSRKKRNRSRKSR